MTSEQYQWFYVSNIYWILEMPLHDENLTIAKKITLWNNFPE